MSCTILGIVIIIIINYYARAIKQRSNEYIHIILNNIFFFGGWKKEEKNKTKNKKDTPKNSGEGIEEWKTKIIERILHLYRMILLATLRVVENHGLKNRQKNKQTHFRQLFNSNNGNTAYNESQHTRLAIKRRATQSRTRWWHWEGEEKQRDDTFEFANWRETQSRRKEKQVGTSSRSSLQHSQCVRVCLWVYLGVCTLCIIEDEMKAGRPYLFVCVCLSQVCVQYKNNK